MFYAIPSNLPLILLCIDCVKKNAPPAGARREQDWGGAEAGQS